MWELYVDTGCRVQHLAKRGLRISTKCNHCKFQDSEGTRKENFSNVRSGNTYNFNIDLIFTNYAMDSVVPEPRGNPTTQHVIGHVSGREMVN